MIKSLVKLSTATLLMLYGITAGADHYSREYGPDYCPEYRGYSYDGRQSYRYGGYSYRYPRKYYRHHDHRYHDDDSDYYDDDHDSDSDSDSY